MRRRKNKKKIIVLTIIAIIVLTITVYGRYIYNEAREAYLASKEFYFSSNILTANESKYEYNNWGGQSVYPIPLELYSYQSSVSKLEYDLDYTVTCSTPDTDKVKCTINSYDENATNTLNGTIKVEENNTSSITVYVQPITTIDQNESVTIEITASTQEPYKKTISTEITLTAATTGTNTYSIEDIVNRDYAILKLTCPTDATTVTLQFDPTKLRIDSNDEVYVNSIETATDETGTYVNKIIYEMPAETTKYIKFYKVDKSQDYTYPGGTLTESPIIVTM